MKPLVQACDVHLLDTQTGERAVYESPEEWFGGENYAPGVWNDFIWTDGNYSCDCNRALFFSRALGRPELDLPCSEGRFVIEKIVRKDTGETIYSEKVGSR